MTKGGGWLSRLPQFFQTLSSSRKSSISSVSIWNYDDDEQVNPTSNCWETYPFVGSPAAVYIARGFDLDTGVEDEGSRF